MKRYYFLGFLAGILIAVFAIISAVITATGAFGADPAETVNRFDFVWLAAGLLAAAFCFYQSRKHSTKNT